GDGGAVVTSDAKVAENVRKLADHGCLNKYEHEQPGFNSRLDSIQAAVLNVKLKYIDDWTKRRREIARFYNEVFAQISEVITPKESSWAEAVYHLYVVQVPNRDIVKQKLNAAGIGAGIHYPIALHLQKAYGFLNLKKGSYPVSEKAAESVLSLPNYPEMTDEMVEYVVEKVKE
ncbi:MAG: DegT/DnrJ/EryC1/StrS family aminotransferase, partial [Ignavibacteria bacterium]|nr:DegT/DnrJ/EryC1/StrS family aminotransferase [Ignavibacteria bacterium]